MRRPNIRRFAALLGLGLLLSIVFGACAALGPAPTPNPACPTGDVRQAKALPQLEQLLPLGMIERSPTTLDSGWNCSDATLGSFVSHGVSKLEFAGATWDNGNGNGIVSAVLALESGALDVAWVEEFYTAGAVAGRHTGEVKTDRPTYQGAGKVFRLETVNDLSLQTIVIWPAGQYVRVVIVATTVAPGAVRAEHDQQLQVAVEVSAAAAAVPIVLQ